MTRVANADSYQVGAGHLAAIYQVTKTLTNAEIKALPTTPITVVASPGSGKMIQPLFATLFAKTAGGAYTNINAAGTLTIGVTGASLGFVPNDGAITAGSATRLTDLLGGAATKTVNMLTYMDTEGVDGWGPVGVVIATPAASAMTVSIDNSGSGALTGGNAANTLTIIVFFAIVDIP